MCAKSIASSSNLQSPALNHLGNNCSIFKDRGLIAACIAALFCLSTALPAQQPSAALPYTVVTRDARRPLATRVIGGHEMFSRDYPAQAFNLSVPGGTTPASPTPTPRPPTTVVSPQQPPAPPPAPQ